MHAPSQALAVSKQPENERIADNNDLCMAFLMKMYIFTVFFSPKKNHPERHERRLKSL
jgi:hypothetical protein